jgi:hypothetical protein
MKILDVPQTGKCGTTVTYPSRYGLCRRAYVIPSNPRTLEQLTVRSRLATFAIGYRSLTQAQQDAWSAAAATHRTRSSLGQDGPLTGLQLYVKINASLLAIGEDAVTDPPAYPAFAVMPISGLVITNAASVVAIKLTTTDAPADGAMLWAAAPQSSGTRRAVSMRLLGLLDSPVANEIIITSQYTDKYGVPAVGQRVFVQVNDNINGWEGPRLGFSAVVPAAS